MDSKQYKDLYEAYLGLYDELDESNTVMSVTSPSGKSRPLNVTKASPARNLEGKERLDAARDARQKAVDRRAPEIEKRIKKRYGIREQSENYDIILSYLLEGGYADTLEAAEGIMDAMSDEWLNDILDEGIVSTVISKLKTKQKPKPETKTVTVPNRNEFDREKWESDRKLMRSFAKK